jgi:hypothetical protein
MTRNYTRQLLEMMYEGSVDPKQVAEMCLFWMSEKSVEEMMRANDLILEEEEE